MSHHCKPKQNIQSNDLFVQAEKLSKHAAKLGFDWRTPEDVLDKMIEEIEEIRESTKKLERSSCIEEIGDLFFALVNFNRKMQIDNVEAFRLGIEKFERRFALLKTIVDQNGWTIDTMSDAELDEVWESVKAGEHRGP